MCYGEADSLPPSPNVSEVNLKGVITLKSIDSTKVLHKITLFNSKISHLKQCYCFYITEKNDSVGHTANKCQSWDLKPGMSDSKAQALSFI